MSTDLLLFQSDSSSGGNLSYVNSEFQDTVLAPTTNSGFSSTFARNPLGNFYQDDSSVRWMSKTLIIKDLQRIEDRSLWINSKPTYRVIWQENWSGAQGYVFGDVRLHGSTEDRYVGLYGINDGFGVGGIIRKVMWIIRPNNKSATASVTPSIDGVTGATITFGNLFGSGGAATAFNDYGRKPYYNLNSGGAIQTRDVHDYRIINNQPSFMEVVGCVVYYNVQGDGLDIAAGNAFVSKNQIVMNGTTLAFPPGISNMLGGMAGVFVSGGGQLGVTTTLIPQQATVATGSSGTNLLNCSVNTGASFPTGTALYAPVNATYYLGYVTSVAGDVLTVSPTLPFGVSNTLSSMLSAGVSQVIGASAWSMALDYIPSVQFRNINAAGTPLANTASFIPFSYSDPAYNYRVWSSASCSIWPSTIFNATLLSGATFGIPFGSGGSYTFTDPLQVDGRFSALEFEWTFGATASLKASFMVDGFVPSSFNENLTGPSVVRRTAFLNSGVGFHNVVLQDAGSTNVMLTRVIGYMPKVTNGPSLGLLATIPIAQTFITRNLVNDQTSAFGNIKRIYADQLYATGSANWAFAYLKGITGAPGNLGIVDSSPNGTDAINFQYFGTQYAVIGVSNTGASISITTNGLAESSQTFSTWLGTGLTLGFQTVVVTPQNQNPIYFGGIDILQPLAEVNYVAPVDSFSGQTNGVRAFSQTAEPIGARIGDEWHQDYDGLAAFKRVAGGWQRMNVNNPSAFYGTSTTISSPNNANGSPMVDFRISDPFNMITSTLGSTTVITIPSDGDYLFGMSWQFVGNSTGVRQLEMSVSGGNIYSIAFISTPSVSNVANLAGSILIPKLKKGNQVLPVVFQNSGGGLNNSGGISTNWLYVQRTGP